MTDTEVKLRQILAAATDAAMPALAALSVIVADSNSSNSDKIKASQQIAAILHKSIDNIELMESAKNIQKAVDLVAENNDYDPDLLIMDDDPVQRFQDAVLRDAIKYKSQTMATQKQRFIEIALGYAKSDSESSYGYEARRVAEMIAEAIKRCR